MASTKQSFASSVRARAGVRSLTGIADNTGSENVNMISNGNHQQPSILERRKMKALPPQLSMMDTQVSTPTSARRRALETEDGSSNSEESRRKVYALVSPRNESLLALESPRRAPVEMMSARRASEQNGAFGYPPFESNGLTPRSQSARGRGVSLLTPAGTPRRAGSISGAMVENKELRREKNRESARKYRQKKRETEVEISVRITELEKENRALLQHTRSMYARALQLQSIARSVNLVGTDDVVPHCPLVIPGAVAACEESFSVLLPSSKRNIKAKESPIVS
eukprot:CAMPEP_0182441684 /NCGR_PEP_ID=MMETSP1172-20130603/668_1 /TAXON_ID=708627 /ORGANISM="Timspurckia oligopyrenoides, Strain CCMP3278" /LENGTH=282 /DNA_ID=CAMNT_0024636129 /DNA_START=27 /DNA_END=875 /DNA_ORIENTATION=+